MVELRRPHRCERWLRPSITFVCLELPPSTVHFGPIYLQNSACQEFASTNLPGVSIATQNSNRGNSEYYGLIPFQRDALPNVMGLLHPWCSVDPPRTEEG